MGQAVRRTVGVLLLVVWATQVIGIAVFAVPDRSDGIETVYLSLLTLVIGFTPVVIAVWWLRSRSMSTSAPPSAPMAGPSSIARPGRLFEPLSERELEILALVARGRSNQEVADQLVVTVATVKTHLNNINRKLGASSRVEAIAIARDHGLLA